MRIDTISIVVQLLRTPLGMLGARFVQDIWLNPSGFCRQIGISAVGMAHELGDGVYPFALFCFLC